MSKKISELPAATTLTNDDELVVNHVDTSGQEPETITSKMTVSNLKSQLGINGKAEKAIGATSGNVATLDSNGNPVDSGKTLEKSVPANAEFTDTQSDWNESDSSKKDYIKNKPTYVGSFNGRTGAVSPAAGDYNFTQVTGAKGVYGVTAIPRGANLNNYIYPTYAGEYLYDTYGSYSGAQNISNMPTGTSGFPFRLIVESLSNDEGTIPIDDEIPTALSNETLQTIICTDPTNKIILTYKRARIDGTWTSWERQGAQDISGKSDISAIGYNETGSTCSKIGGYTTGDNFYKDGKFCTAIATINQGATFTENTNYVKGTIADAIKSLNSGLIIAPNAGYHNSIFRGEYLGSSISTEQYASIQAGTFNDMYVGDHWTFTINNTSVNCRIAGFDLYMGCGYSTNRVTKHHVVIVPDISILDKRMNATATSANAFLGSEWYTGSSSSTGSRAWYDSKLQSIFGTKLLKIEELLSNAMEPTAPTPGGYLPQQTGSSSGWAWDTVYCDLLTEVEVYGSRVWSSGWDIGNGCRRFPLFEFMPEFIFLGIHSWWLRGVASSTHFCFVGANGDADFGPANNVYGIRPKWCIG